MNKIFGIHVICTLVTTFFGYQLCCELKRDIEQLNKKIRDAEKKRQLILQNTFDEKSMELQKPLTEKEEKEILDIQMKKNTNKCWGYTN